MDQPFYTPWEGKYFKTQCPRLLLLGESHYGDDADFPDATIKNTRLFVDGEMNHRFWTNVMKTVLGPDSTMGRREFWDGVAFYNYVQRSVGKAAGDRPTHTQFQESAGAFFSVLDDLQPHAILVMSKTLWLNMPGEGERSKAGPVLDVMGDWQTSWIYTHPAGSALTTWIRHPSRFFSWRSHDVAKALLAACADPFKGAEPAP